MKNLKPYSLPRNRSIEMMSTTISTNMNCNMACRHCYIQPDLLRVKEYMDEASFRKAVEVIIDSFHLDQSVTYLHLDVLGGEATLMPFEFWQRNLPWVLGKIGELNDAGIQTEFTFCSNLMWRDERYLELLRSHRHHPAMDIAVGFEGPASHRFGNNMKLFPKFLQRIEALGDCNMLNLVLIMGQSLLDLGPQYIIENFVKRGVTDVTCDMIFPWGSGKDYFEWQQPLYQDVARYIAELTELGKPYGLTVDHLDDMRKSLRTLSRSQNTLNDAYEYHWDHKGLLSLNPNQTGTEAVRPYINLSCWDANAPLKVVWGNNSELDNKLSFEHDFCRDCEYLQACNSGWYPHKDMAPERVRQYMTTADGSFTCPGFYELWKQQAKESFDPVGVTRYGDLRRLKRVESLNKLDSVEGGALHESKFADDYEGFFEAVKESKLILMTKDPLFGCTPRQRLWFYDRLGKPVVFAGNSLEGYEEEAQIIAHSLAGNYHSLPISDELVWSYVRRNPDSQLSAHILDALSLSAWTNAGLVITEGYSKLSSGLEVSFKYEDLIIWALQAITPKDIQALVQERASDLTITSLSYEYMARIAGSAARLKSRTGRGRAYWNFLLSGET